MVKGTSRSAAPQMSWPASSMTLCRQTDSSSLEPECANSGACERRLIQSYPCLPTTCSEHACARRLSQLSRSRSMQLPATFAPPVRDSVAEDKAPAAACECPDPATSSSQGCVRVNTADAFSVWRQQSTPDCISTADAFSVWHQQSTPDCINTACAATELVPRRARGEGAAKGGTQLLDLGHALLVKVMEHLKDTPALAACREASLDLCAAATACLQTQVSTSAACACALVRGNARMYAHALKNVVRASGGAFQAGYEVPVSGPCCE